MSQSSVKETLLSKVPCFLVWRSQLCKIIWGDIQIYVLNLKKNVNLKKIEHITIIVHHIQ